MGRRTIFRLGFLCVIVFLTIVPVRAQELVGREVSPASHGINTEKERSQSSRFRYANVNSKALENATLSLNLFADLSINATERGRGRQFNAETWTGQVEGYPLSSVVLARDDSGVLFGKVEFEDHTFLIRPKKGRVHAILEVADQQIEDEGFDDGVPFSDAAQDAQLGKLDAASACSVSTSCPSQTIDVMVVYTGQARTALGGTHASAQAAIAAAVAEMNAANANSGVTHTFNLVYADEVSYIESNNSSTDLSRLSGNFDGYMDVIHAWRDTYGADLVSLITATGGCGIGYVQNTPTALSPNAAFNVVRHDCLTTNRSLAHEFGHNMGLQHDWYVSSSTSPCLWHHGYVNQEAFGGTSTQRWRTIMAYNNQCSDLGGFNCDRIAWWSNPLNLRSGDAMGIPQGESSPSDVVFGLNRTACQVAEFRASISLPDPPMYPTGLVASGISVSSIDVDWTDNADNETGYKVERSSDGVSGWSEIASLSANIESYLDSGLPAGSHFYYRAYAFHATAPSEYSNVDSASTTLSYNDHFVTGESVEYGVSAGEFQKTTTNDGVAESILEEETAGLVQNRTSRLDVTWQIDIPAGVPSAFYANAWTPASTDGDQFRMSYSTDGVVFSQMFLLSESVDADVFQTFDLGVTSATSIWIRLEDTDRGRGNRSLDQVFVDHMYVRTQVSADQPTPETQTSTIHLGDLQATTGVGKNRWTSTVMITVHDGAEHGPESGASVRGVWSNGDPVECVTDASGACEVTGTWKSKVASVTFAVTEISRTGVVYDAPSNEVENSIVATSLDRVDKFADDGEIPVRLTLRQNYPNPFNPTTVLEYGVPEVGPVRVSVFNMLGKEVRRLQDGVADAGWHSVTFDGSDLSSGVYFATVHSVSGNASRTMLLTK